MTMYRFTRPACMTAEEADRFGTKRHWWLLDRVQADSGAAFPFVNIGKYPPATDGLRVNLLPGRYLLGAGPPGHYREDFEMLADGTTVDYSAEDDEARIPCITPRCDGVLACSGESCEPFELCPPASRLCLDCRGRS